MEQKTPSDQDAGATRRRMRMLRELEAYGIPPDVVVAALKLAAALAVGALAVPLAALLLVSHTDSVARQPPAEGEVGVEFVTLPDGASPSGTAAPDAISRPVPPTPVAQPDTPQRDVHSDGGQFFLAP